MKNLTILLLLVTVATVFITSSLLNLQQSYISEIRPRGGTVEVNLDMVNFWTTISPEDLRLEDPDGWARLSAMDFTPERTRLADQWAYEMRQRIFLRRYGYPYNER